MQHQDIYDYGEYRRLLQARAEDAPEWRALIERLLNHETCFFRHPPSYEALADLIDRRVRSEETGTLRLWSAGCSTGEEVYTLSIVARERLQELGALDWRWSVEVLGSDLSTAALSQARRGRYPEARVRALPRIWQMRYLTSRRQGAAAEYQVGVEAREGVRFQQAHLLQPETYPQGAWDAIFCQHVLIYFPREARATCVRHLAARLAPGGQLFFAPGEVADLTLPGLTPVRRGDHVAFQRSREGAVKGTA